MKDKIAIIDGNSLLYQAFYAIPVLTDSQVFIPMRSTAF